jgi:hypothetical protein
LVLCKTGSVLCKTGLFVRTSGTPCRGTVTLRRKADRAGPAPEAAKGAWGALGRTIALHLIPDDRVGI